MGVDVYNGSKSRAFRFSHMLSYAMKGRGNCGLFLYQILCFCDFRRQISW